jgi:hypothetical protein
MAQESDMDVGDTDISLITRLLAKKMPGNPAFKTRSRKDDESNKPTTKMQCAENK